MPGPRRQANGLPCGARYIMRPALCGMPEGCRRGLFVSRIWTKPLCPAGRCNLRAAVRLGKASCGCVSPAGCALRGGFSLYRRACLPSSTLVAHTCRAPPAADIACRRGQAAAGKQACTQHKGLPCRERAPVITPRPGRRHASTHTIWLHPHHLPRRLDECFPTLTARCQWPASFHAESGPPAKPGACVSSGRAYCRQASQEALDTLSLASPAPPPVNGVLPAACCIFLALNTPSCLVRNWQRKPFHSPRLSLGLSFR